MPDPCVHGVHWTDVCFKCQHPEGPIDKIIAVCRDYPDDALVRYQFNQGEWQTVSAREFLELWDTPVAGAIYVDWVAIQER